MAENVTCLKKVPTHTINTIIINCNTSQNTQKLLKDSTKTPGIRQKTSTQERTAS